MQNTFWAVRIIFLWVLKRASFLFVLICFLWNVLPVFSKTWYVSPSGDDLNNGTRAEPFASPGYASRQIQSGDSLVILGGNYSIHQFDDDIITPPSGTKSKWTTIMGEPGHRPVLKGSGNLLSAVIVSGKSYIRIGNIEICSDNGAIFRDGIQAMGGGVTHHITFNDLFIHHIDEFAMDFDDVQHVNIINCELSYCGFGAIGGPAGQFGGWKHVLIDRCRLTYCGHYYQGGPGPGPYDRPDGFGIEPSDGPVEIVATFSGHNRGDGLDSKAANTYIHECIVANNSCDGIKLWAGGSKVENCLIYGRGDSSTIATPWAAIVLNTSQPDGNFEFVNLTIDDYVGKNYFIYMQYDYPEIPINVTMRNCIFSSRGENSIIFLAPAINYTIDHNLFFFPGKDVVLEHGNSTFDTQHVADIGPGNLYGDPLFVAPAFGTQGDYHLRTNSPAIDAGDDDGAPSIDLENSARPHGRAVDMGCYEISETSVYHKTIPARAFKLHDNYPNPFNPETEIGFDIPAAGSVRVTIYNSLGRHVVTLADEYLSAGSYCITWNGCDEQNNNLASGIYYFCVQFRNSILTGKMILAR